MLRKLRSKEKLHGVEYHRVNTKDSYKNILLNANLSKTMTLNYIGRLVFEHAQNLSDFDISKILNFTGDSVSKA